MSNIPEKLNDLLDQGKIIPFLGYGLSPMNNSLVNPARELLKKLDLDDGNWEYDPFVFGRIL